jgi:hypothetical protein
MRAASAGTTPPVQENIPITVYPCMVSPPETLIVWPVM